MTEAHRFHIIYTPETVRPLCVFAKTLLEWSDASFRLVANGCAPDERARLQQFCAQDARLEYVELSPDKMLPHGQALNVLQARCRDDAFCFMDSDIYATGPFWGEFEPHLGRYSGTFSCSPAWCREVDCVVPPTHPKLAGRFKRTATGICLGGTFFAIYDNRAVTALRQSDKVGFDKYTWQELPAAYRDRLRSTELQRERYDTGKVLNLGLLHQGHALTFVNSRALHHLGGLASDVKRRHEESRASPALGAVPAQAYRHLKRRLALNAATAYRNLTGRQFPLGRQGFQARSRRLIYAAYFWELLRALSNEAALPKTPVLGEDEIVSRIAAMTDQIVRLYERHGRV